MKTSQLMNFSVAEMNRYMLLLFIGLIAKWNMVCGPGCSSSKFYLFIYLFIYIALLLLYFKFKKIAQYEDKLTSLTNATRTLFVLAAFF